MIIMEASKAQATTVAPNLGQSYWIEADTAMNEEAGACSVSDQPSYHWLLR